MSNICQRIDQLAPAIAFVLLFGVVDSGAAQIAPSAESRAQWSAVAHKSGSRDAVRLALWIGHDRKADLAGLVKNLASAALEPLCPMALAVVATSDRDVARAAQAELGPSAIFESRQFLKRLDIDAVLFVGFLDGTPDAQLDLSLSGVRPPALSAAVIDAANEGKDVYVVSGSAVWQPATSATSSMIANQKFNNLAAVKSLRRVAWLGDGTSGDLSQFCGCVRSRRDGSGTLRFADAIARATAPDAKPRDQAAAKPIEKAPPHADPGQTHTERSSAYIADLERQSSEAAKLIESGGAGVDKQLGRWRTSSNSKDQARHSVATKILVCSAELSRLKELIDQNLLVEVAAIEGALACLKPDTAVELIDVLAKKSASPRRYQEALALAMRGGQVDVVRPLLEKVVRPSVTLEAAVDYGSRTSDFSVAELLVKQGADVNRQETITDYAPRVSININGQNVYQPQDTTYPEGPTPLYYAIRSGNASAVAFLLSHGADKAKVFRVEDGKTSGYTGMGLGIDSMTSRTTYTLMAPSQFACGKASREICQLLEKARGTPGQGRPEFTGEWTLNKARSNFGRAPVPDQYVLKIDHNAPSIVVITMQVMQGEKRTDQITYSTDGGVVVDKRGDAEVASVTVWSGKTLVTRKATKVQQISGNSVDKWSLSEDGKVLTIESSLTTSFGTLSRLIVLDKK